MWIVSRDPCGFAGRCGFGDEVQGERCQDRSFKLNGKCKLMFSFLFSVVMELTLV